MFVDHSVKNYKSYLRDDERGDEQLIDRQLSSSLGADPRIAEPKAQSAPALTDTALPDRLLDRLRWYATYRPEQVAYQFLADDGAPVPESKLTTWTYRDLFLQVQKVAEVLTAEVLTAELPTAKLPSTEAIGRKATDGKFISREFAAQRILLIYRPGLELVAAFLGCMSVGAIAVPVPPPRRHESLSRWQHILTDASASGILTTQTLSSELTPLLQAARESSPSIKWAVTDVDTGLSAEALDSALINSALHTPPHTRSEQQARQQARSLEEIAFLQYTSGSTSQPKGVMVTHKNLAHNLQQIQQAFGHSDRPSDQSPHGVIWLPPYHDMGLIGGILQPLYGGYPVTLMSPASFLRRPLRWLEAISYFGGTTSGGPNFAYDYCVQKITPTDCNKLNLSCWQVAFTGAEPVQAKTLQRFSDTFSSCGFKASAFYPCYGLAESTLFVSGGSPTEPPVIVTLDRQALLNNRAVEVGLVYEADGKIADERITDKEIADKQIADKKIADERTTLVSAGEVTGQEVQIVDPQTGSVCKEQEIGEIWLSGESVAAGYWNQECATQQAFQATLPGGDRLFLKTGDLGFLFQDELFVTGRLTDLIIIRGQNYYPQDIEQAIRSAHPDFASASAAFSLNKAGKETLVVAQEVTRAAVRSLRKGTVRAADMTAAIRSAVSNEFGLQVEAIALLKPGKIPRTTSGKVQRHRCRALFESDQWDAINATKPDRLEQYRLEQYRPEQSHPIKGQVAGQAPKHQQSTARSVSSRDQQTVTELLHWLRNYAHEHIESRQMDERRCLTPGVVLDFGNQGLLGMQVPRSYGGLGLGHQAMLDIIQQLGAIDPTLALFVGLNNVLGIRPILRYGSEQLKAEWLPKLAAGRELAAFALTETGAGSHPVGIAATATPTAAGWQLQGEKIWSGSAAWAGIINVFVQQIDDAGRPLGIAGFAVEKGTPGLRQGPEALTMGMRGMVQNTVLLNQVPVEATQQLGEAGTGMGVAQDAMQYGRLAIAAACVGGMKRCAQLMLRYARRRRISTGRLLDNPVLLSRLSWLRHATALVESLVTLIATRLDRVLPVCEDLYAACKIIAPELYWQATDSLMQSLGGRGYIETNLAPQMLRDARVLRIFEGPTEAIAMHLGACTLSKPESLRSLFADLEQPQTGELLFKARQTIEAVHDPFVKRLSQYQLGKASAWALSVASMKATQAPVASIKWGERQLDQAIEQALGATSAAATTLDAERTAAWIADYESSIGSVDSLAAIADLDELLQPEILQPEIASSPAASSASVARSNSQATYNLAALTATPTATPSAITQEKALTQWMRQWIAEQLNADLNTIDPARTFADYGLDSVMAVELAEDLSQHLQLSAPLEATLAWNFPTISTLAAYLSGVTERETSQKPAADSPTPIYASKRPPEPTPAVDDLQQLSEAELAQALSAELATMRGHNA